MKTIKESFVKSCLAKVQNDEITFSRFVELLNEQAHEVLNPTELRWEKRYSEKVTPDIHGRWARKCFYKDLHIAWVKRVENHKGDVRFAAITQFPTNGNDSPHSCLLFNSFEIAKHFIEQEWKVFARKLL